MSQATARLVGEGWHLFISPTRLSRQFLTRSDNEARASYLRQLETLLAQLPLRGHPTERHALMLRQSERQLLCSQARCKEKPRPKFSRKVMLDGIARGGTA
jgi:hypothetical protein